ncbi:MAG: hypothetical protein Q7T50_06580, partial [Candidatus Magasanikbacteria bacterium]|nr:hypothetical protein [Candidatus Magasanikbacteria bacterium]
MDDENIPKNIGWMNKDEIKKWLFESMMKDVAQFVEELGIKIDTELISKIQNAKDENERSALELEYTKKVHRQVCDITSGFDQSPNKGTKWDSWPKRMRETKEFNCVGATLVGMNLLKSAGIESYYGNPHGHVLNIVRLPNNEWWYVDFRNGKNSMIKIDPEETTIDDARVLKIEQPGIDYKLIPIYDNSESAGSILGNLGSLKRNAEKPDAPDDGIDKKEAKEYFSKHQGDFQKVDFESLHKSLYPKFDEVGATKEMQEEGARIRKKRDLSEPILSYSRTLNKEQLNAMSKEMKDKKTVIGEMLYQGDASVLNEFSPELGKVLELYLEGLERLKGREPEI